MKKLISCLIVLLGTFFLQFSTASAHLAGQPPYFVINNTYANLYPVPLTSLSDFSLPQDLAPQNYLLNQSLNMFLDTKYLPAPPEVISKTKFTWDFGDGGGGLGLKQNHTYTKMGSYILKITAYDGTTPTPQLLESVLINILPDPNYKLPQAVIKVNGQTSKDPLTDILHFSFSAPRHFDAGSSTAPSSTVKSYFWDFGDTKSSDQRIVDHSYPDDQTQIFPVLRIVDGNGFISDTFLEIENTRFTGSYYTPKPSNQTASQAYSARPPYLLIGLLVFGAGLLIMVRLFVRAPGREKRQ